jgi:hypothetical protein
MTQTQSATKSPVGSFYAMMALRRVFPLWRATRKKSKRQGTMRLAFAMLADAVQTIDGKLEIHGGDWDTVTAPRYPVRYDRPFILLVRLEFDANELSTVQVQHTLNLEVFPPNRDTPWSPAIIAPYVPVRPTNAPDRPVKYNLFLNFSEFVFPEPGTYRFRLSENGVELGIVPVYAVLQEPGIPRTETGGEE